MWLLKKQGVWCPGWEPSWCVPDEPLASKAFPSLTPCSWCSAERGSPRLWRGSCWFIPRQMVSFCEFHPNSFWMYRPMLTKFGSDLRSKISYKFVSCKFGHSRETLVFFLRKGSRWSLHQLQFHKVLLDVCLRPSSTVPKASETPNAN